MEQKKRNSTPITLLKIDRVIPITRGKYVKCKVFHAGYKIRKGKKILGVGLKVDTGIHKGLKLYTSFYDTFKSGLRLTHLCTAAGIFTELENPEHPVGRRVKLRVVPDWCNETGRTLIKYNITRFHPVGTK